MELSLLFFFFICLILACFCFVCLCYHIMWWIKMNILVDGAKVAESWRYFLKIIKKCFVYWDFRQYLQHKKAPLQHFKGQVRPPFPCPCLEAPMVGHTHVAQLAVGCVAQLAERRSLAGELTLSCARPAVDGWPPTTMWVNRPLQVSQPGQLSLSSSRGR